ncbi:hypothetical protein PVAND_012960 [Polypedilum vanderplanki]|uniref:Alkaline phosphatase n=1 Tax=Polypedilum vanderplanki TaxID=319348 RepID=A0A9J6CQ15_POLVA|nr:hypothetical protein PVAND_012960 [Polypedilum vanderplanki]
MAKFSLFFTFIVIISSVFGDEYHNHKTKSLRKTSKAFNEAEKTTEYWVSQGQDKLKELVNRKYNNNNAKNVIFFLGDGMSITTISAARTLLGGEEKNLYFDNFPYTGYSKTYCVDAQVADSACTATAYLTGVKNNYETIGITAKAKVQDCDAHVNKELWTESIVRWAQKTCKATGIVTTTRITHASPAGAYAHTVERDWENDFEVSNNKCDADKVDDIAEQLIYNIEGKNLNGKDLIEEWKSARGSKASYIWNNIQLKAIDYENTDYILGLFEHDHMKYNKDVVANNLGNSEPTLSEMTEAAIKMLQKEENGYFLFIEGGMIDQAHHYNYAQLALDETDQFQKAIEVAHKMTNNDETLIVVTADHSHVFTYNGYPPRGSPIFEAVEISDVDDLPYTTLSYANGPGYEFMFDTNGNRKNPATFDFKNYKLQYPATVPLSKETHGGEDVAVYATGPMAHLFNGHYEQNTIPLIMAYILKVGPYAVDEKCTSCATMPILILTLVMILIVKLLK